MTVNELCEKLSLSVLVEGEQDREIEGCYIGDLLSWVMGRAGENNAWITVMGNVNAVAVAKLGDISCIILCEESHLDAEAKTRAEQNGIAILSAVEPAYELAVKFSKLCG